MGNPTNPSQNNPQDKQRQQNQQDQQRQGEQRQHQQAPGQQNDKQNQDIRDMFSYCNSVMEPWDGPATVPFTDGRYVGAVLDRNGLRPSRYTITYDGLVVLASETGVIDDAKYPDIAQEIEADVPADVQVTGAGAPRTLTAAETLTLLDPAKGQPAPPPQRTNR